MYTIGFVLSLILTFCAFGVVWRLGALPSNELAGLLVLFALLQLLVQFYFFLHIGEGEEARWNVVAIAFAVFVVVVVVGGSLWIMRHLNHMQGSDMMMEMYDEGMVTPVMQHEH